MRRAGLSKLAQPAGSLAEGTSRERVVFDRITVEPGKMHGQPYIRSHRFTVAHLVRLVAAGTDVEQIQQDFPNDAHGVAAGSVWGQAPSTPSSRSGACRPTRHSW